MKTFRIPFSVHVTLLMGLAILLADKANAAFRAEDSSGTRGLIHNIVDPAPSERPAPGAPAPTPAPAAAAVEKSLPDELQSVPIQKKLITTTAARLTCAPTNEAAKAPGFLSAPIKDAVMAYIKNAQPAPAGFLPEPPLDANKLEAQLLANAGGSRAQPLDVRVKTAIGLIAKAYNEVLVSVKNNNTSIYATIKSNEMFKDKYFKPEPKNPPEKIFATLKITEFFDKANKSYLAQAESLLLANWKDNPGKTCAPVAAAPAPAGVSAKLEPAAIDRLTQHAKMEQSQVEKLITGKSSSMNPEAARAHVAQTLADLNATKSKLETRGGEFTGTDDEYNARIKTLNESINRENQLAEKLTAHVDAAALVDVNGEFGPMPVITEAQFRATLAAKKEVKFSVGSGQSHVNIDFSDPFRDLFKDPVNLLLAKDDHLRKVMESRAETGRILALTGGADQLPQNSQLRIFANPYGGPYDPVKLDQELMNLKNPQSERLAGLINPVNKQDLYFGDANKVGIIRNARSDIAHLYYSARQLAAHNETASLNYDQIKKTYDETRQSGTPSDELIRSMQAAIETRQQARKSLIAVTRTWNEATAAYNHAPSKENYVRLLEAEVAFVGISGDAGTQNALRTKISAWLQIPDENPPASQPGSSFQPEVQPQTLLFQPLDNGAGNLAI